MQRPLEEAFGISFSHPDFSRLATVLFHLRPPSAPRNPQLNLSEVLRFYEGLDHHSCLAQLLLLKTLCLTALASGNRCSDLAHLSRHSVVHLGTSFTLPVMPRFFYKNAQTWPICPDMRSYTSAPLLPYQ